jgi:hypothetical protein
MKKNSIIIILICLCFNAYSQKDSIINFLDKNGKITIDKAKVKSYEIITRESDSLWLVRKYRKDGSISNYYYSKDKKRKTGQSLTFNRHGKKISVSHYNKNGEKHGYTKQWFHDGVLSLKFLYLNGKKEGVWKSYHHNTKVAALRVYKNDSIVKEKYFNEQGFIIEHDTSFYKKKPFFTKGSFKSELRKIRKLFNNYQIKQKGKLHISFIIDIDGKIRDVLIDEDIPEELHNEIVAFIEKIDGWEPGYYFYKKVPICYTIPLIFK